MVRSVSRAFALKQAHSLIPLGFTSPSRTFAGVGISGGLRPQVLARELVSGPSYVVRTWDVSSGAGTIFGSSTTASGPKDFDSASSMLDMNDRGVACVSALINGSTTTVLLIGASRPLTQVGSLPAASAFRPQMADSGEVVTKDNTGRIALWTSNVLSLVLASAQNGFTSNTGNRPGISSDGSVIAFSGDRGAGQGSYAALRLPGIPPTIIPFAGGELQDGFSSFSSEQRVAASASHSTRSDVVTLVFQGTRSGIDGIWINSTAACPTPTRRRY